MGLTFQDRNLSRDSKTFLRKTARSIVEIQPGVNSTADVMVFLEVLGYTDRIAVENGFKDLYDLATHIYEFVDHYADTKTKRGSDGSSLTPIPTVGRRLAEGLTMAFPWLASLVVLYVFGVSLWLAWGLPLSITTALIAGVFLGLLLSEGPIQVFSRLFVFYYNQANVSEAKRLLTRSFGFVFLLLLVVGVCLYLVGTLLSIPQTLMTFTMVAAGTIALHRTSYVTIYSMRKLGPLVVSYSLAIISLLAVYFLSPNLIPQATTRYLVALGSAFGILSIAPIYYGYRIFASNTLSPEKVPGLISVNPLTVIGRTMKSRFGVQLWETAPYYLYGTFFFCALFGDRVLSWVFNPVLKPGSSAATHPALPMVFNSAYHMGADVGLLVLFPAAIVQYVIMAPIFDQLSNEVTRKVSEARKIDRFLSQRYQQLVILSVIASLLMALLLAVSAPAIISRMGGSQVSVQILQVAALSNVLMSVFAANGLFMVFLNRIKMLAVIAMVGTFIVGIGGVLMAQSGFQNIVFAYLASTGTIAALSSLDIADVLGHPGSNFFSRFV